MNGISIVVCCYNSADRLPETIKHLAKQKLVTNFSWEVIIVDNASKDDTKEIALQEWVKYKVNIPFNIINELKPGLAYAREAGVNKAQYNLILFCDDDNWLDELYLHQAFEIMEQNPTIGCLGGCNEAIADVPLPVWFNHFEPAYACGPQNENEGWLVSRSYICGAGMVVNKDIFDSMQKVGFTSLLSDRTGSNLSSGGDNEISIVALIMGYGLYYSPKLKLKHYMVQSRLNWGYLKRLIKGHAKTWYFSDLYLDVYKGKPLKKNWFHESSIRLFYFFKEEPFTSIKRWASVGKREGDIKCMGSFMVTEKLLAHLFNLQYKKNVEELKSLYIKIGNLAKRKN